MLILTGADHPAIDRLEAFSRGDLTEVEALGIEEHLTACESCQNQLAAASTDDSLQRLVREVGSRTQVLTRVLQAARERVAQVGGASAPSGYEIIESIGRGGMGIVFKARQRALGRIVALKQIRRGLDADSEDVSRFQVEAEAAARLRHPGIVQIYDFGVRDGLHFLSLEYVEGGTLADRLRDGPLKPREGAELVARTARAVQHAHDAGIVHRDLKPSNILLTREGAPKVSDFGLAKRLDVEHGQTQTGVLLGTPSYMAPEQADGRTVGPASDIYSLGAILYEILTGRPPFQAATPLETLEQARSCDPAPPSRLYPGVSRELQTIALKCLDKSPTRRYPAASALADDLERFLQGIPIVARPAGAVERTVKWARRRPSQAALLGFALVAIAVAFAGLVAHQQRLQVEINRANKAATLAETARERADANYREARAAIQRILDQLHKPELAGIPRTSEMFEAQANAALSFYDRILGDTGSDASAGPLDPTIALDTALAAREAANLQIVLGKGEEAEANLNRAIRLLDDLIEADPDNVRLLREHLASWVKLGVLFQGVDMPRSTQALERALAIGERIARREDNSTQSQLDRAWCEHNLGAALFQGGQAAEAEPHYARAVALHQRALSERPDDQGLRVSIAGTLGNIGLIQMRDHPKDAEATLSQAASYLEAAREHGYNPQLTSINLAQLLVNWGTLAYRQGNAETALARFARGLELVEPILRAQPGLGEPKLTALQLHGARANVLDALGRFGDAVADWDQVIALNSVAADLPRYRLLRLLSLARAGDHRRAIPEVQSFQAEWLANADTPGVDFYNLACLYALCASAVRADGELREEERGPLATQWESKSVEMLREGVRRGYLQTPESRAQAWADSDLTSIHGHPDFLAIAGPRPAP